MNHPFLPLLFGGDINVYSVARAFHEAYGLRSLCFGKFPSGPAFESEIIQYEACRDVENPAVFLQKVREVAEAHPTKTILLIACGDSYVKLAAEGKALFPSNVIAPYVSGEQIAQLTHKERFYRLCEEHGLAYPATYIYTPDMGHNFTLPFDPPFVCKPSNGVAYWEHPFEGNEKVFICHSRDALLSVLDKVYASGYADSMIIQDFIPGDDSFMRVLTSYSDQHGRVALMCLGHVLLEEHTPHGIGNHAVILTEENQALCETFRGFLEAIHFQGFSNFDIKFDQRDGLFKVFEINCRQGRSNYYVTGAGYNISQFLVDDLIQQRTLPLTMADKVSLWRVVPKKVAFDYIPSPFHPAMKQLMDAGRDVNPLFYAKDKALKRRLRLMKNQLGHFKKYHRYYEKKS